MKRRVQLVAAALAAAAVMSLMASAANANRGASVLSGGAPLNAAIWAGNALTFGDPEGIASISCEVTLRFSLHRSIAKVEGALAGFVTEIRVNTAGCNGGRARALTETLPWHIRYISFRGTLPNEVRGITLALGSRSGERRGTAFLIEEIPIAESCLYEGIAQGIAEGARNRFERLSAEIGTRIPLARAGLNGFFCPGSGEFVGTGRLREVVEIRLL
jgi:hypothetical protein